jgi:hypothetical protein
MVDITKLPWKIQIYKDFNWADCVESFKLDSTQSTQIKSFESLNFLDNFIASASVKKMWRKSLAKTGSSVSYTESKQHWPLFKLIFLSQPWVGNIFCFVFLSLGAICKHLCKLSAYFVLHCALSYVCALSHINLDAYFNCVQHHLQSNFNLKHCFWVLC